MEAFWGTNSVEEQFRTAEAYLGSGQAQTAIGLLREVLRQEPCHVGAHFQLAQALRLTGQQTWRWLISIRRGAFPGNALLRIALGIVLADIGHQDAAIRESSGRCEITPDYAEAYSALERAHHRNGRLDAAPDGLP